MESNLYAIAYFSRNTIQGDADQLKSEISNILKIARANNSKRGVTGALLYSDRCFAQVLEGPLASVETVFEQIECDGRHRDIKILHFRPIEVRSFGAWSMGFVGGPERHGVPVDLEGLIKTPADIESGQAGRDVVTILSDLIRRHEDAEA